MACTGQFGRIGDDMCSRSTYQNPYVNLAFGSANKGMGSAGSIAAASAWCW